MLNGEQRYRRMGLLPHVSVSAWRAQAVGLPATKDVPVRGLLCPDGSHEPPVAETVGVTEEPNF